MTNKKELIEALAYLLNELDETEEQKEDIEWRIQSTYAEAAGLKKALENYVLDNNN